MNACKGLQGKYERVRSITMNDLKEKERKAIEALRMFEPED
jgi:hypothetical protein